MSGSKSTPVTWTLDGKVENAFGIRASKPLPVSVKLQLLKIETALGDYFNKPDKKPIAIHATGDIDIAGDLLSQQALVDSGFRDTPAVYRGHRSSEKFVFFSGYLTSNCNFDFMPLAPKVEYHTPFETLPEDTLIFPYRPRFIEETVLWHQSELPGGVIISVENRLPSASRQCFLSYEVRVGKAYGQYREFDKDVAQGPANYPGWMAHRVIALLTIICETIANTGEDPATWLTEHFGNLMTSAVLFHLLNRVFPPLEICVPNRVARANLKQYVTLMAPYITKSNFPGRAHAHVNYESDLLKLTKYIDIKKYHSTIDHIGRDLKKAIDEDNQDQILELLDPERSYIERVDKTDAPTTDPLNYFFLRFDVKHIYFYSPELFAWVTPLIYATYKGNVTLVDFLLAECGQDVNALMYRKKQFYYLYPNGKYRGETALYLSLNPATGGSVVMTRRLLQAGANPHQVLNRYVRYSTVLSAALPNIPSKDLPVYTKMLGWPTHRPFSFEAIQEHISLDEKIVGPPHFAFHLFSQLLPAFMEYPIQLQMASRADPTLDKRDWDPSEVGLILYDKVKACGPTELHTFQIQRLEKTLSPIEKMGRYHFFNIATLPSEAVCLFSHMVDSILYDGLHSLREFARGTRRDFIWQNFGSTSVETSLPHLLHLSTDDGLRYETSVIIEETRWHLTVKLIHPEKEEEQAHLVLEEPAHLVLGEAAYILSCHFNHEIIETNPLTRTITVNQSPILIRQIYESKALYEGSFRLFEGNYFPMGMRRVKSTSFELGLAFEGGHNNHPFNLNLAHGKTQLIETEFKGLPQPIDWEEKEAIDAKFLQVFSPESVELKPLEAQPVLEIFSKRKRRRHIEQKACETEVLFPEDTTPMPDIRLNTLLQTRHTRFVMYQHLHSSLIPFVAEDHEFKDPGRYYTLADIRIQKPVLRQFEHEGRTVTPFKWLFEHLTSELNKIFKQEQKVCRVIYDVDADGKPSDQFGKIAFEGIQKLCESDPFLILQAHKNLNEHHQQLQQTFDGIFGSDTHGKQRVVIERIARDFSVTFSQGEILFLMLFEKGKSYDILQSAQRYLEERPLVTTPTLHLRDKKYHEVLSESEHLYLINKRFWTIIDDKEHYDPDYARMQRFSYLVHKQISDSVLEHVICITEDKRLLTAVEYRPDLILATEAFWQPHNPPTILGSHAQRDEGVIAPGKKPTEPEDKISHQQYHFEGEANIRPMVFQLEQYFRDGAFYANLALINMSVISEKRPAIGYDQVKQKFITLQLNNCLSLTPKAYKGKRFYHILNPYLRVILDEQMTHIETWKKAFIKHFKNLQSQLPDLLANPTIGPEKFTVPSEQIAVVSRMMNFMIEQKTYSMANSLLFEVEKVETTHSEAVISRPLEPKITQVTVQRPANVEDALPNKAADFTLPMITFSLDFDDKPPSQSALLEWDQLTGTDALAAAPPARAGAGGGEGVVGLAPRVGVNLDSLDITEGP